jgi:hypothetical protein
MAQQPLVGQGLIIRGFIMALKTHHIRHNSSGPVIVPSHTTLRPETHCPHVTWAHVMLRVQLRYFNIEFWRTLTILSTLLTSRDLTWSSGRLTCQHASQISVIAHILCDKTYASSALRHCCQLFPDIEEIRTEKVRQRTFLYDTKSPYYRDQHDSQRRGRNREGVENKT